VEDLEPDSDDPGEEEEREQVRVEDRRQEPGKKPGPRLDDLGVLRVKDVAGRDGLPPVDLVESAGRLGATVSITFISAPRQR
jgi:hypothetical protein